MTSKEAIKLIQGIKEDGWNVTSGDVKALDLAIKALQERPQGEWLPLSDISPSGFGTWVCSQCGHGFRGIKSKMPYCTCGAEMRGKEE